MPRVQTSNGWRGLKPGIKLSSLADADQTYDELQVILVHTNSNTVENGKYAVIGIKHYLLAVPWIANHKTLAAVRKIEMRDFDRLDNASNLNACLTLVEITRLAVRKGKRKKSTLMPLPEVIAPEGLLRFQHQT